MSALPMENITEISQTLDSTRYHHEDANTRDELFQQYISTLPKENNWNRTPLYLHQGFWYPFFIIKGVLSFQKHFRAHHDDIILTSTPKSGTTWLKALIFLIANRRHCPPSESPLLRSSPHQLVRTLEVDLYGNKEFPDLEKLPRPRIFSTHVPYASLPASIKDSNCKIVYVCRNPLDLYISLWHFSLTIGQGNDQPIPVQEGFERYLRGIHAYGPFCDHVLGFWKASQENPNKVLFLKYEELKDDIISYTKRIAEFLGFPFSEEEERQGLVEEISRLCSFNNMKDLEANKIGRRPYGAPHSAFFRKGEVGDWANFLTPNMAEQMKKIVEQRFGSLGLDFDMSGKARKDSCA